MSTRTICPGWPKGPCGQVAGTAWTNTYCEGCDARRRAHIAQALEKNILEPSVGPETLEAARADLLGLNVLIVHLDVATYQELIKAGKAYFSSTPARPKPQAFSVPDAYWPYIRKEREHKTGAILTTDFHGLQNFLVSTTPIIMQSAMPGRP